LVSVLMPTHNRPCWLAQAIESVLDNTFTDFEVVVSNNGDPEHTRDLARRVPDPRIRWLEHGHYPGQLDNILAALSCARGRYVAFLHDDDRWGPELLSALVPPLESNPDAVLSFSDHHLIDANDRIDQRLTDLGSERWGRARMAPGFHQPFHELAVRQSVPITSSVFRRESFSPATLTRAVGPFNDIWMIYQLARTGGAVYYDNRRLSFCRQHSTSLTNGGDLVTPLCAIRCRTKMLEDPDVRAYGDILSRRLAQDHLTAGGVLLRKDRRRPARAHLSTAVRMRPSSWKAIGGLAASWLAPASLLRRL
jgi:glycosyltransferase involved in cell wall biosynthesis